MVDTDFNNLVARLIRFYMPKNCYMYECFDEKTHSFSSAAQGIPYKPKFF